MYVCVYMYVCTCIYICIVCVWCAVIMHACAHIFMCMYISMYVSVVCFSEPGVVSNLMSNGSDVDQINITWNQPSIPNGIIIMYDIRYRETDNNDSFIYVNGTTNTQHTIDGLTIFTNYTIGVRAHTIAGPGEWIDIQASTLLPGIFK